MPAVFAPRVRFRSIPTFLTRIIKQYHQRTVLSGRFGTFAIEMGMVYLSVVGVVLTETRRMSDETRGGFDIL